MKLALQRKASKKLVDRKEDVLGLVRRTSTLNPASVAEAVEGLKELESAADELGLPLTGDVSAPLASAPHLWPLGAFPCCPLLPAAPQTALLY